MDGRPIKRGAAAVPEASRAQAHAAGLRILNSVELLAGANEVVIDHNGEAYRLRCTSNGKLILTK